MITEIYLVLLGKILATISVFMLSLATEFFGNRYDKFNFFGHFCLTIFTILGLIGIWI